MNKFERTLRTGVCLVNSGIMKGEEPICPAQFDTKKRSKGKPRDEVTFSYEIVQLTINMF